MDKSGLVYRLEKTGFSYNDYATILESDIAPTDPVSYTFSYGGCQWRIQLAPREGWRVMGSFGAAAALGLVALFMLTALTYILLIMHDKQKGLAAPGHDGSAHRAAQPPWPRSGCQGKTQ